MHSGFESSFECCALDLNVDQAAADDVASASVNVTATANETAAATEPAVEVVEVGPETRGFVSPAKSTSPQH